MLSFRNRQPALTDCNYVLPGTRSVWRTKCAGKHWEDYCVVLYKISITHSACLALSPLRSLFFTPFPLVSCYFYSPSRKLICLLMEQVMFSDALSRCLPGCWLAECMQRACYCIQGWRKDRHFYAFISLVTIILHTMPLFVHPALVDSTDEHLYADLTMLGLLASRWTVWWNSFKADLEDIGSEWTPTRSSYYH